MYPLYKAINQKLNVIHKTAEHIPPHLHQAVEFVYVTKGTLAFGVGQELFPMEEGDFAVAFPNMIHHYQVFAKEPCEVQYILAALSLCGVFADDLQKYYPKAPVIPRQHISKELRNAIAYLTKSVEEDFVAAQAYLQILLAKSFPLFTLAEREGEEKADLVYQAVTYMAAHFQENITLSQMASALGVSKYMLSRVFSGTFHCNFNKYLNETRLDYACALLEYTGQSITDVCMTSGFESQRTFNRVFRQEYHMTPREFRKNRGTAKRCGGYSTNVYNC